MKVQLPKDVLNSYDIGKMSEVKVLTDGLVHKTFLIKSLRGSFILQRLHPVLSSQAIGKDFLAVTKFLHEHSFLSAQAVLSKKGDILVRHNKEVWRMQTRLSGETFHVLKDEMMARECGEIYARFHRVMNGFEYTFQSTKILHETEKVYEAFLKATKKAKGTEAEEMVNFVEEMLPKFFLPPTVPMRVIHGDPKISNILFDRNGKAHAIIDLDTCNRRPLLVELGDAFRSWCAGAEDDPNNKFSLKMFRSAWCGYKQGALDIMTKREIQYIPKAIGTITLELAARFLTDYVDDKYFGWDSSRYTSRKAHNLARARGQIAEFLDYEKKLPRIKEIVGAK